MGDESLLGGAERFLHALGNWEKMALNCLTEGITALDEPLRLFPSKSLVVGFFI
jgi:hypothetical protein